MYLTKEDEVLLAAAQIRVNIPSLKNVVVVCSTKNLIPGVCTFNGHVLDQDAVAICVNIDNNVQITVHEFAHILQHQRLGHYGHGDGFLKAYDDCERAMKEALCPPVYFA